MRSVVVNFLTASGNSCKACPYFYAMFHPSMFQFSILLHFLAFLSVSFAADPGTAAPGTAVPGTAAPSAMIQSAPEKQALQKTLGSFGTTMFADLSTNGFEYPHAAKGSSVVAIAQVSFTDAAIVRYDVGLGPPKWQRSLNDSSDLGLLRVPGRGGGELRFQYQNLALAIEGDRVRVWYSRGIESTLREVELDFASGDVVAPAKDTEFSWEEAGGGLESEAGVNRFEGNLTLIEPVTNGDFRFFPSPLAFSGSPRKYIGRGMFASVDRFLTIVDAIQGVYDPQGIDLLGPIFGENFQQDGSEVDIGIRGVDISSRDEFVYLAYTDTDFAASINNNSQTTRLATVIKTAVGEPAFAPQDIPVAEIPTELRWAHTISLLRTAEGGSLNTRDGPAEGLQVSAAGGIVGVSFNVFSGVDQGLVINGVEFPPVERKPEWFGETISRGFLVVLDDSDGSTLAVTSTYSSEFLFSSVGASMLDGNVYAMVGQLGGDVLVDDDGLLIRRPVTYFPYLAPDKAVPGTKESVSDLTGSKDAGDVVQSGGNSGAPGDDNDISTFIGDEAEGDGSGAVADEANEDPIAAVETADAGADGETEPSNTDAAIVPPVATTGEATTAVPSATTAVSDTTSAITVESATKAISLTTTAPAATTSTSDAGVQETSGNGRVYPPSRSGYTYRYRERPYGSN